MKDLQFFPTQASQIAVQIDNLYFSLLGISATLGVILAVLVIVFCVRYRRGVTVERRGQTPERFQRRWEFSWTLIPILIFLGLFVWGGKLYMDSQAPVKGALEIQAIGKQWMWKFQHPDGQREINELHLPVNRPVQMTLATQDVIHSFYVPAFRVKQDLVPGRYTRLSFTPNRVGEYRLFCAEYCGTEHSQMRGKVVVMELADYQAWLDRQDSRPSLAAQGERLFRSYGCSGCHAPQSSVHAPSLAGVFGRVVQLQDGSTVIADEAYIRDSILLPERQVVAGYEPIMPSFAGQIDEADILKIVAYIKSLAFAESLDTSSP